MNAALTRNERRIINTYANSGRYIGMESLSSSDIAKICDLKSNKAADAVKSLAERGLIELDGSFSGCVVTEYWAAKDSPWIIPQDAVTVKDDFYRLSPSGALMFLSSQTRGRVQ